MEISIAIILFVLLLPLATFIKRKTREHKLKKIYKEDISKNYQLINDKLEFEDWCMFYNSEVVYKGDLFNEVEFERIPLGQFSNFLSNLEFQNKFFIPIKITKYQDFQNLKGYLLKNMENDSKCFLILNKKITMFEKKSFVIDKIRKDHISVAFPDDLYDFVSDYEIPVLFKN